MDEAQIKAMIAQALQAAMGPITEQLGGIAANLTALNTATPPAPAASVTPPAPAAPAAPPVNPELNSQVLELRRSNEALVARMAAADKLREEADRRADESERTSVVNGVLGGFQFATDAARQTALEKIMPQIKRTDTGALVAGDNLTPEAFIKDFLPTQHAYLLAPVGAGGSGVTPGQGARGAQAVDLNSIKPDMSPETRAAAIAAIRVAGAGVFTN